jgi:hypothetical protein
MSSLQITNCHRMGISAFCRPTLHTWFSSPWRTRLRRGFRCAAVFQSGHNRWSKIKHDKGDNDAAKSKARSCLSQDIVTASRRENEYPRQGRAKYADQQQLVAPIRLSIHVLSRPWQMPKKQLSPKPPWNQPSLEDREDL